MLWEIFLCKTKNFLCKGKKSNAWINVSFNILCYCISCISLFKFFFPPERVVCLKEKEVEEASKVSAEIGSSAGLMVELDLKGFFQPKQFSDSASNTFLFLLLHQSPSGEGNLLQLLINFIPVGFPQIACPVSWEHQYLMSILNVFIYIWKETESIRALHWSACKHKGSPPY